MGLGFRALLRAYTFGAAFAFDARDGVPRSLLNPFQPKSLNPKTRGLEKRQWPAIHPLLSLKL